MASPLSASAALTVLKAEGLVIQEFRDWRTNNRNHVGAWGPVYGVMIHHTVTSPDDSSVELCYEGHSSLPGPLCHSVGRNDGRIAMVGWGRANHAGSGDDDVLAAVIAERDLPADNEANTDGNRHFYGLEIVNLGNNEDTYPWVQYVAAVKWAAALCRKHGWSEKSVIGHLEWQPGKIDPRGPVIGPDGNRFAFTMDRFRTHVRGALARPAGAWPVQEEETVTPEDIKAIAVEVKRQFLADDALLAYIVKRDNVLKNPNPASNTDNPYIAVGTALNNVEIVSRRADANVKDILTKVNGLAVGGIDVGALAAALAPLLTAPVADELSRRLAD